MWNNAHLMCLSVALIVSDKSIRFSSLMIQLNDDNVDVYFHIHAAAQILFVRGKLITNNWHVVAKCKMRFRERKRQTQEIETKAFDWSINFWVIYANDRAKCILCQLWQRERNNGIRKHTISVLRLPCLSSVILLLFVYTLIRTHAHIDSLQIYVSINNCDAGTGFLEERPKHNFTTSITQLRLLFFISITVHLIGFFICSELCRGYAACNFSQRQIVKMIMRIFANQQFCETPMSIGTKENRSDERMNLWTEAKNNNKDSLFILLLW